MDRIAVRETPPDGSGFLQRLKVAKLLAGMILILFRVLDINFKMMFTYGYFACKSARFLCGC